MSKYVKNLELKTLRRRLDGATDVLIVNVIGMEAFESNQLRLDLRKKGIELAVMKNTYAKKIFGEMGLPPADSLLQGTTAVCWGGEGIVELAREITETNKKHKKFEIKGAVLTTGTLNPSGVDDLSKLPSRVEMLGKLVGMILGPGGQIVSLANGPGAQLASQIKTIAEPEEAEAAAAAE